VPFLLDSWTLDFMSRLENALSVNQYDEIGKTVIGDDGFLVEAVRFVDKKTHSVWVETVGVKTIVGRCAVSKGTKKRGRVDDLGEKERLKRDRDNLKRSCKRAYKRVVDCVGGARCDRMLTLTFQENIVDIDIALIAFQKFIALSYAEFGHFDYVAVPERQKRGAVHYHVALNRFFPWEAVLDLWRQAVKLVSKLTGGIDIRKKKIIQSKGESKISALARYIAKYVSKAFYCTDFDANTIGRKRYYSNMRITREIVRITSRHDDILITPVGFDGKEYDFSSVLQLICGLSALFVKKYSFLSPYCGFSYRYETEV
jgi:hypothetical protein